MKKITNGWASMPYTYEDRKVENSETDRFRLSTASVSDGDLPYETYLQHMDYHPSSAVIDAYRTKKEAKIGHEKWLKKFRSKNPPKKILDCQNSHISQLCNPTLMLRKK